MNSILLAVIIVSCIGVVAGIGLAIASIVMAVPVDEKTEAVLALLPGVNCGACGYSGCSGYAEALASAEVVDTSLCAPGGNEASKAIAEYLGIAAANVAPTAAVVMCQGTKQNTDTKLNYSGVRSCKMAAQLFGGPKDCIYGCIGYGDCVVACPYDAIQICDGTAVVNPLMCRACKMCVSICPKGIIEMLPLHESKAAVLCMNKDKGAMTRKQCKAGCIGCMRCVKACEFDAVTVTNNVAHVDYHKCTSCGKCVEVCPVKCISMITLGS